MKNLILAAFGGITYAALELLCRGHTHWTMILMGGICFLMIGGINEYIPWEMPLLKQSLIGAALVTAAEFVAGCILNLWLGLGIWDYGGQWGNIFGQICPLFSLIWIGVSMAAIVLDDWLRYLLWGEEWPHYKFL